MTRDILGAVICSSNANRTFYEVYMGRSMFGVGKNDSAIFVFHADLKWLLDE